MRRGTYDEQELERQLQARGLMYRFFGRFMRSINHTWQLYFVGLVFGIGFDTATEVRPAVRDRRTPPSRACPSTPCSPCRSCSPAA